MLNSRPHQEEHLKPEAFLMMTNLRLLKIYHVKLPLGLSYLPNDLRLLEWYEFPLTSMPRSFQPGNLVELIMPCSRFEQLSEGFRVRFLLMRVSFIFYLGLDSLIYHFLLLFCLRI